MRSSCVKLTVKKVLDKTGTLYIINGLSDIESHKKSHIARILYYDE